MYQKALKLVTTFVKSSQHLPHSNWRQRLFDSKYHSNDRQVALVRRVLHYLPCWKIPGGDSIRSKFVLAEIARMNIISSGVNLHPLSSPRLCSLGQASMSISTVAQVRRGAFGNQSASRLSNLQRCIILKMGVIFKDVSNKTTVCLV